MFSHFLLLILAQCKISDVISTSDMYTNEQLRLFGGGRDGFCALSQVYRLWKRTILSLTSGSMWPRWTRGGAVWVWALLEVRLAVPRWAFPGSLGSRGPEGASSGDLSTLRNGQRPALVIYFSCSLLKLAQLYKLNYVSKPLCLLPLSPSLPLWYLYIMPTKVGFFFPYWNLNLDT